MPYKDITINSKNTTPLNTNSYMKLLSPYYNDSEKENGYNVMLDYWLRFNQSLLHVFENTNKPVGFNSSDIKYNPLIKYFTKVHLIKGVHIN